jgi:hypothetical protein
MMVSRSSTTSRSASPLPWATHSPPQARITGSMAVTTPLAGVCTVTWRPCHAWLNGSRFETTISDRSPKRLRMNCLSRSSVQTVSLSRRSRASSSMPA